MNLKSEYRQTAERVLHCCFMADRIFYDLDNDCFYITETSKDPISYCPWCGRMIKLRVNELQINEAIIDDFKWQPGS